LHYQVQASPVMGAKTIDYPFAYYHKNEDNKRQLLQFTRPGEGDWVAGIMHHPLLKNAFDIMPNKVMKFRFENNKGENAYEQWEAYTDSYNNKYLYCKETESSAYYVNDGSMFYFTAFYGNKKSLLYYFYLSVYKVFLGNPDSIILRDAMPLNVIRNKKTSIWIHDFVAPFYNYIRAGYSIKVEAGDNLFETGRLVLKSGIEVSVFGKHREESNSIITLHDNRIQEFVFESSEIKIRALCIN